MTMVEAQFRRFKLSLTLKDDAMFSGAHAVLALMKDSHDEAPLLVVEAGGFPPNEEGAGELSDMLRDAADAIDDHLKRPRPHTDTATLPILEPNEPEHVVAPRPRFNPQPRGGQ